jgi:methane/ammonia monooxygenase subunit B
MHSILKRALALTAAATAVLVAAPVAPANAHGETAQESFLRMGTMAFVNTEFGVPGEIAPRDEDGLNETTLKVGDEFTITGTAKVLNVWPQQLGEPEMGFVGVVTPGPVVLIKERAINGRPAPAAIEIEKGGVYNYEMTLVARRPGTWHVHPIFGVQEAGSLLGPGLYLNIDGDLNDFENMVTLKNGDTVNLEDYGKTQLYTWNIFWFILGMIWLLYWIVPKPTVTRLPVNLQIPLNTDGEIYGLITKRDHRVSDAIMAVTLVATLVGMIWQGQAYPTKLAQQVLRYEIPSAQTEEDVFATAEGVGAEFDVDASEVKFTVNVTNEGESDATVTGFSATTYTWTEGDDAHPLVIEGTKTIPPGETAEVTLVMKDDVFASEKLMPVGESRLQMTGVVLLEDGSGNQNYAEAQAFVIPSKIGAEAAR